MSRTARLVSGFIMVCLACAFVTSDNLPLAQEPAPLAKAATDVANLGGDLAKLLDAKVDTAVATLEKQLLPQITPLMTSELSFINRACDLNLEQRQKIKAASDICLKAVARQFAMAQRSMINGRVSRSRPTVPDPNELLHLALAKVLEETLLPEQQAAYQGEMAKRAAYRKRVAVDNCVAILDEHLLLTADQRGQLTESLENNWQPQWLPAPEMLMNDSPYLPDITDQFVVPVLNETQKQVWRTTQKHNDAVFYVLFGGFNGARQGGVLDDFPLVEAEVDVESKPAD